jgi:hypothetical protein
MMLNQHKFSKLQPIRKKNNKAKFLSLKKWILNQIKRIMGVFKSMKNYQVSPDIIPTVVGYVCDALKQEQYEVHSELLTSGGADISITKGGVFKAVVGMKTALKVTIVPNGIESFTAEAGVGIFGAQAIPTALTMLVAWPVMIPQIWGLIEQSKLDEHVLGLIQQSVDQNKNGSNALFCPNCGHKVNTGDKFCGGCGAKL